MAGALRMVLETQLQLKTSILIRNLFSGYSNRVPRPGNTCHSRIWTDPPPKTNLLVVLTAHAANPSPCRVQVRSGQVRPGQARSGQVRICGFDYHYSMCRMATTTRKWGTRAETFEGIYICSNTEHASWDIRHKSPEMSTRAETFDTNKESTSDRCRDD